MITQRQPKFRFLPLLAGVVQSTLGSVQSTLGSVQSTLGSVQNTLDSVRSVRHSMRTRSSAVRDIPMMVITMLLTVTTSQAQSPNPRALAAVKATAPDPGPSGPFSVATGEYKFSPSVDPEVLPSAMTELWARVFWPKDLSQPHPILFFLHGNHPTCGTGARPRVDSDCTYTADGYCPTGMEVVPNHEGYDYLASHMATYGYVVVSINANRGITCGEGSEEDSGLVLARGRLVLKHLAAWYQWATNGNAPAQLGLGSGAFIHAIDFSRVGLLGHSRGGEGMRAAYNLYHDAGSIWKSRIPGLDIRGIFEIGSVDGQSSRTLDADSTAWNQILPMCDGDVQDLQGRNPFERMSLKTSELRPSPKSLYMVWGANHNFFNTEWQSNDSNGCEGHQPIFGEGYTSEAQQKVAVAAATSFFLGNVGGGEFAAYSEHFDPLYQLPSWESKITRVDRDYLPTFDKAFDFHIENFDQPTGMNSHHIANQSNGITIEHEVSEEPPNAEILWSSASTNHFLQVNFAGIRDHKMQIHGAIVDQYSTLDFRISRKQSYAGIVTPTNFTVSLADNIGNLSLPVKVSDYAAILGPVNAAKIYQTVRIPLKRFGLKFGTEIRGVRFTFNQSSKGAIQLAQIHLASPLPSPVGPAPLNLLISAVPRMQGLATDAADEFQEIVRDNFSLNQLGKNMTGGAGSISRAAIKVREFVAEFVSVKPRAPGDTEATNNNSTTAVDIEVKTAGMFPVSDEIPTLILANQHFTVSRVGGRGDTGTLIFKVPLQKIRALPTTGPMYVQYGLGRRVQRWLLPNFTRSQLLLEE